MPGGVLGWVQSSLEAAARVLPGDETPALMSEMANRLEVFSLFENAGSLTGASPDVPLHELFAKAAGEGPYRSAWIIEGIAHLYSTWRWSGPAEPSGIFSRQEVISAVPERLLTVAHVGLASVLGERVLANVALTGLDGAVPRFYRLCRANAYPGYEKMCVELLGFVTAMLSPGLMLPASRHASRLFPEAEDYFWHGTGRAAYFSAVDGMPVPGAHERTIRRIDRTRPHTAARMNATAGWAWALTLVNIRQPELVAKGLDRARKVALHPEAVTEGAGSGLRIWTEINPDDGLAAPHRLLREETTPVRDLFRYSQRS